MPEHLDQNSNLGIHTRSVQQAARYYKGQPMIFPGRFPQGTELSNLGDLTFARSPWSKTENAQPQGSPECLEEEALARRSSALNPYNRAPSPAHISLPARPKAGHLRGNPGRQRPPQTNVSILA